MKFSRLAAALAASLSVYLASCVGTPQPTNVNEGPKAPLPPLVELRKDAKGYYVKDDFLKLAQAIGGKDIVALGEQTHGAGASFAARAELVEYLVETMGFDAILFEASMFGVMYGARSFEKTADPAFLSGALWDFWGESVQNRPLLRFVAERASAGKPLALGGFDARLGSGYAEGYAQTVRMFVEKAEPVYAADKGFTAYMAAISRGAAKSVPRLGAAEIEAIESHSQKVQAIVSRLDPFLGQTIKTSDACMVLYSRVLAAPEPDLDELSSGRDRLMADNMAWLLEGPFKGKKILLIGATYHFIRNPQAIQRVGEFPLEIERAAILGDLIGKTYGDRLFTLGFSAVGGSFGHKGSGTEKIGPLGAKALERRFADWGAGSALLILGEARGEPWFTGSTARLFSYDDAVACADWSSVLDAIFFIREMEPVRY